MVLRKVITLSPFLKTAMSSIMTTVAPKPHVALAVFDLQSMTGKVVKHVVASSTRLEYVTSVVISPTVMVKVPVDSTNEPGT